MIEIKNLKKYYGKELVIDDVSLNVGRGEIFAIVGHSGAGKSTLLRCINALESYEGGSLRVFGEEISALAKHEKRLRQLRRDIGMIFQHFALMSRKSVFENVAMPLQIHHFERGETQKRVSELLELVGLADKANSYPGELSGGQKQRVAIARALALRPKILLSDEATSALDPNTTKNILELIRHINKELKISVVLVTHEMEVVKEIAAKAVLLDHGHIIGSGAIHELFLKPNEKMREFLGESDFLPEKGVNIKLFFPKESAQKSLITQMARELNIDFNIVWGKIEKLNGVALGNLVINVAQKDKAKVLKFIEQSGVLWEVAERNSALNLATNSALNSSENLALNSAANLVSNSSENSVKNLSEKAAKNLAKKPRISKKNSREIQAEISAKKSRVNLKKNTENSASNSSKNLSENLAKILKPKRNSRVKNSAEIPAKKPRVNLKKNAENSVSNSSENSAQISKPKRNSRVKNSSEIQAEIPAKKSRKNSQNGAQK